MFQVNLMSQNVISRLASRHSTMGKICDRPKVEPWLEIFNQNSGHIGKALVQIPYILCAVKWVNGNDSIPFLHLGNL